MWLQGEHLRFPKGFAQPHKEDGPCNLVLRLSAENVREGSKLTRPGGHSGSPRRQSTSRCVELPTNHLCHFQQQHGNLHCYCFIDMLPRCGHGSVKLCCSVLTLRPYGNTISTRTASWIAHQRGPQSLPPARTAASCLASPTGECPCQSSAAQLECSRWRCPQSLGAPPASTAALCNQK